jgi:SPP1 family phage portal protein
MGVIGGKYKMKYRLSKDQMLTSKFILEAVREHNSTQGAKIRKLNDYYKGKQKILHKQYNDPTKPNNKIVNPFANYITDMLVGYFMGNPVSYGALDTQALNELQMILSYNDEQDVNSEIAKGASIAGVCYELIYVDEDAKIRFKKVGAEEVVIIYDDTLDNDILYAIRYYPTYNPIEDTKGWRIDVYDNQQVEQYKTGELFDHLQPIGAIPHPFTMVPFVEYKNNEEELGDFEPVISLIDAYDEMESNSLNDYEYFCDAYLALTNMTGTTSEDIMDMKENRVMLLPENSEAQFLVKQTDVSTVEALKTRLVEDIHKFSKCPSMTDANFASNASGVAMKYKIMGMENLTSIKERKFKKGLQRRIELIFDILDLYGNRFDWRGIDITFTRNLPVNELEMADLVNKLRGLVSEETLITQLPFVDSALIEMEKRKQENNNKYDWGLDYETQSILGEQNGGLGEVRE